MVPACAGIIRCRGGRSDSVRQGTLKAKSNPSHRKFHVAVRHFIIWNIDKKLNRTSASGGRSGPKARGGRQHALKCRLYTARTSCPARTNPTFRTRSTTTPGGELGRASCRERVCQYV